MSRPLHEDGCHLFWWKAVIAIWRQVPLEAILQDLGTCNGPNKILENNFSLQYLDTDPALYWKTFLYLSTRKSQGKRHILIPEQW
jgi:hypothetical protein